MSLTPYAAAGAVNAALTEAGVSKEIPPQMMYNYTTARVRKGKAPLIPVDVDKETGKVSINEAGFVEWLQRYVKKQVALASV